MNTGINGLLQSRRFWTVVFDLLISLVLYFGGKYAGAQVDDIKFFVASIQPVVLLVIAAFTVDDVTAKIMAAGK